MKNALFFLAACATMSAMAGWKTVSCPGSGSTMLTEWGEKVTPENAWREYPRPQMERANWQCLNGLWEYAITTMPKGSITEADSVPDKYDGEILVPYAIESPLSGVGRLLAPNELLWYRRTFKADVKDGERLLLNFEGVDQRCQVFVNGIEATDVPHVGGLPFSLDVTAFVKAGENTLVLLVWDPTDGAIAATGKQSMKPHGCMYTRSSGVFGTVWTETVPEKHIRSYRVFTDVDKGTVRFEFDKAGDGEVSVSHDMPENFECWTTANPKLYHFTAKFGKDVVRGYFGMRKIEKRKDANGVWRFYLNNEPVFLQGPLDQGWWPDGFLTPPADAAMVFDISTLKNLGFNMMRKHIKVEPRRYYWHCDRLGIMIVQDQPSGWGDVNLRYTNYRAELKGMLDLLQSIPSIVMWCPYNEGWGQPWHVQTRNTLLWVKRYDPSRLVNAPSGWDDYEGGVLRRDANGKFRAVAASFVSSPDYVPMADTIDMHNYRGPGMHPVNPHRISFLGEFGGLGHAVSNHLWKATESWGYGGTGDTATREGLEKVYLGLMDRLGSLAYSGLAGSVYTQTTDVELEINGYLTYDRKVLKFNAAKLRAAHEKVYRMAEMGAKCRHSHMEFFPRYDSRSDAWAYSTDEKAADGWMQPDFDDSAWKRSAGGFGGHGIDRDHAEAKIATPWNTKTLRVRHSFEYDGSGKIVCAALDMFHDEDTVIYLNGVKVFEVSGFNINYQKFALDANLVKSAIRKGRNVFAAEIHQTIGGQYFDCAFGLDIAE